MPLDPPNKVLTNVSTLPTVSTASDSLGLDLFTVQFIYSGNLPQKHAVVIS